MDRPAELAHARLHQDKRIQARDRRDDDMGMDTEQHRAGECNRGGLAQRAGGGTPNHRKRQDTGLRDETRVDVAAEHCHVAQEHRFWD